MSKIEIIPLGTVSPYPKENMNCPGFLIKYNNKNVLLDCGNGITRFLKLPKDLENLNVIITHYHKDHFGDIGALQYASYVYHNLGILNSKIKIYLPENDINFSKQMIISSPESYAEYFDINDNFSFSVDDLNVSFKDNNSHSIESFMVKLQNKDFKIVYTSDVGITNFNALIDFCKDADLLICESSFLKRHNSNSKAHLTAYDASILAKKSNSKKLLLTHFWPEEDKNSYLNEAMQNFQNVEASHENKKLVLERR